MPARHQEWAAVIKSYYVTLTVSLDLCQPRGSLRATALTWCQKQRDQAGPSVFAGWDIAEKCGESFLKTHSVVHKRTKWRHRDYTMLIPLISAVLGGFIVSESQCICIKIGNIIIIFNLFYHHSFCLYYISWKKRFTRPDDEKRIIKKNTYIIIPLYYILGLFH